MTTLQFCSRPSERSSHDTRLGFQAHRVLDLIGSKWSVDVLLTLSLRPFRHGQLLRTIGGISQKMLTQTLRELERARLVHREVKESTVKTVEYSLTPAGESLLAVLRQMHEWAVGNMDPEPLKAVR